MCQIDAVPAGLLARVCAGALSVALMMAAPSFGAIVQAREAVVYDSEDVQGGVAHAATPSKATSPIELESLAATVALPSGTTKEGYLLSAFHPATGLYWWTFWDSLRLSSTDRIAQARDAFSFFVSDREIVGFAIAPSPETLRIRSGTQRVASLPDGRGLARAALTASPARVEPMRVELYHRVNLRRLFPSGFLRDADEAVRWETGVGITDIERLDAGWKVALSGPGGRAGWVLLDQNFALVDSGLDPLRRRLATTSRFESVDLRFVDPAPEGQLDSAELRTFPRVDLPNNSLENLLGRRAVVSLMLIPSGESMEFQVRLVNTSGRSIPTSAVVAPSWFDILSFKVLRGGKELPSEDVRFTVAEQVRVRTRYARGGVPIERPTFRPLGRTGYWDPIEPYDEVLEIEEPITQAPAVLETYEQAEVMLELRPSNDQPFPPGVYRIVVRWDLAGLGLRLGEQTYQEHFVGFTLRAPADN